MIAPVACADGRDRHRETALRQGSARKGARQSREGCGNPVDFITDLPKLLGGVLGRNFPNTPLIVSGCERNCQRRCSLRFIGIDDPLQVVCAEVYSPPIQTITQMAAPCCSAFKLGAGVRSTLIGTVA